MFQLIGFLVVLVLGIGGVWEFDHHGPIGFHTKPLPLVGWTFGFDLPPSLQMIADRDAAGEARAKADLDACQHSMTDLRAAAEAQNAALMAQKADSDRRAAMLVEGLQATRKTAATAQRRADELGALMLTGSDQLARYEQDDAVVVEGRR